MELNPEMSTSDIVAHFSKEGMPKPSIYAIVRRVREGKSLQRKPGSGRKPTIMTKAKVKILEKAFRDNDTISQRVAAAKFNCHHSHIYRTLRNKTTLKCFKKKRSPPYTEAQKAAVTKLSRRLCRKSQGLDFVIDDEHYFPLSKACIPGNRKYYSSDKENAPPEVKYYFKKKYEKKIMLWIAISPRGLSPPFFVPAGLAVNQYVYRDKCLKKILVPFIKKKYPDGQYLFWPDKASSHYAKSVVDFLQEENVRFVGKDDNPVNLPQARPIEDFFGLLDQMVYDKGWEAENLKQLKNRVKYCLKKVEVDVVRGQMESVRRKLRMCAEGGPFKINH
jgi:transposase